MSRETMPDQLFSFIYLNVWFTGAPAPTPPTPHTHAPSSKWLGRESELVSTSKLRYPFMCFSGNGLTQWEASKYSSRDYRRQVTLAYAPQPTAWINVTFEQQPKCCCLILWVFQSWTCWSYTCALYGLFCVFVLVFHTSAVFYLQLWAQVKSRVK